LAEDVENTIRPGKMWLWKIVEMGKNTERGGSLIVFVILPQSHREHREEQ